ncbi:hypothetical protein CLHUN_20130 [Ruminiclostridium hungatei]|uniref:Lipoprotein n=1 Tax=Ruminiclostridium hungatei TaxID=48256 RepID=A0A1V4SJC4_RUMHU|nr:hypothetical protein [Ruminiclostridium hungatei]OPX43988.1 hypothetical protein CLHUN_20130 [Ruminiclostridium hungatei]
MKKLNTIFLIILILVLVGCQTKESYMTENLIKAIDNECGEKNSCQIQMKDVTNFKWDKVVIFQVGSSNKEISKALDAEYKGATDLISGMVFVYNNQIADEELVPYDPENPNKLQYFIEKKSGEPNCLSFSADDAVFEGSKDKIDGTYYYKITARTK